MSYYPLCYFAKCLVEKTPLTVSLFILCDKMLVSVLVGCFEVGWICIMGQLPLLVSCSLYMQLNSKGPSEAISHRARMSRLLLLLSGWGCSSSESGAAWSPLRSAEQSGVGIKITTWHHCQIFLRLSRTFQVQLSVFFKANLNSLWKKVTQRCLSWLHNRP